MGYLDFILGTIDKVGKGAVKTVERLGDGLVSGLGSVERGLDGVNGYMTGVNEELAKKQGLTGAAAASGATASPTDASPAAAPSVGGTTSGYAASLTAGANPYAAGGGAAVMKPAGLGGYQAALTGGGTTTPTLTPTGNQSVEIAKPDSASTVVGGAYLEGAYDKNPEGVESTAPSVESVPSVSIGTTNPENAVIPTEKTETGAQTNISGGSSVSGGASPTPAVPNEEATAPEKPIMTYEEWLKSREGVFGEIKSDTEDYYNKQESDANTYLDKQYQDTSDYASHIKDVTDGAVNSQYQAAGDYATGAKENADKYVNSQYDSSVGYADYLKGVTDKSVSEQATAARDYANSEYDKYSAYLAEKLASDTALAESDKEAIAAMSEEQRAALVAAAERQRAEAYTTADVERQRGVVDAKSSYEQNKSTYGANAEAMASMGLSGGGYAAYLNERAYGTQRAEVQAANAQAANAKRQAQYTKDQAELEANATHNQNLLEAEKSYKDRLYEINSGYSDNLYNAGAQRDSAIYNADAAEREGLANSELTYAQMLQQAAAERDAGLYQSQAEYDANMFSAESDKREGLANSELTYSQMLKEAADALEAGKYEAKETAEAGKFGADMQYKENLLNNDAAIAEYRENERLREEEKTAAAEETNRGIYAELLTGASGGTFSEATVKALAEKYGLSAKEVSAIGDAAANYKTEYDKAENTAHYMTALENVSNYYAYMEPAYIEGMVEHGQLTAEQGEKLLGEMKGMADRYWKSLSDEDKKKNSKPPILDYMASRNMVGPVKTVDAPVAGERSGTLTYEYVKAYNSDAISEAVYNAAPADSELKKRWTTYQAYLQAVYNAK